MAEQERYFGERRGQSIPVTVPTHEEEVPETPTDAVGRYCALLLQEQALTRRQAKYEEDLKKLQATGDALREEWEALKQDRTAALTELAQLTDPPEVMIERAWTFFKAHLALLCANPRRFAPTGSVTSQAIQELAEAFMRHPNLS